MLYAYEAVDNRGKTVTGTTDAGTPADARAVLRDRGILAYRVERTTETADGTEKKNKISVASVTWFSLSGRRLELLTQFTRHLAMLLKAGLPLAQALAVLAGQLEDKAFRQVVEDAAARVKEGASFDEALAAHPRHFPELYVHVVRAGAAAGELPRVLAELAGYYARQKRLRDKVVSALTYPALMASVGVLVLIFLLIYVVPKVTSVLIEQKRALPWPTEVLLFVSGAVSEWWWAMILGAGVLYLVLRRLLALPAGARLIDRMCLSIPVLGDLLRKQVVARWSGTMSTLLASGLPVAQALAVVRGAVGNRILAEDIERLEREIVAGASLSDALKRSRVLPPAVGFVAGVGEESGELAEVLREVAGSYTEEVEIASGRLTDLLNPVLIVCLGVVVGFIVAAILLPITDFSSIR